MTFGGGNTVERGAVAGPVGSGAVFSNQSIYSEFQGKIFTSVSFKLIETLSAQILPKGGFTTAFWSYASGLEDSSRKSTRVFHFSEANKINLRHNDCPIIVGSFSGSMQILIWLCWLYKIPITLYMPRLRYEKAADSAASMATYKLASVPIQTYVATDKAGGSFKLVDAVQECIEDEPCWKLGGYGMYPESQPGRLLSGNDDEYIKALEQADVVHLLSLFGFAHCEYPLETENGAVDLTALQSSICEGIVQSADLSLESINSGWGLNPNRQENSLSLLSLSATCGKIASQYDLKDMALTCQRNNQHKAAKTSS